MMAITSLYHDVGWEQPPHCASGAFVQPSHELCLCLSWENMRASSGLAVAMRCLLGQIQMDVFSSRVMVTERQLGGGQPVRPLQVESTLQAFGMAKPLPESRGFYLVLLILSV